MTAIWPLLLGVAALGIVAFCSWRAVASARTPQGAIAWVIFLLAAPWFGVPAYVIFGHHKLRAYTEARRRSRELTRQLAAQAQDYPPRDDARQRLIAFARMGKMPIVGGNDAGLLIDGEETFEAIFEAIEGARRYVCVQFYTIVDDAVGQALADRLVAAAERGVTVRVIYDGVGSYGLSRGYRQRLTDAGIRILDPRAARGPTSRLQINFRNHRKTVIVDGETGFMGGLNVSETYLGRNPAYGAWRDTHLRLRGPIVSQLQLVFAEDWHWATGESLADVMGWYPGIDTAGMTGLLVPMGPGDDMDTGALFFFSAITGARNRVWIASPYFVPDIDTLTALSDAALRGCDVRLIVPDTVDHYLPWLAAFAFFDEVRRAGVKVHRYQQGFMHQKVVLVDDDIAAVGTANFDNRSFRLNFETMAVMHDAAFAREVETMLTADLKECTLLEQSLAEQPLPIAIGAPLARLLAPVL